MKNEGLQDRYSITKKSNPGKKIDAIVLEFDDPIASGAILHWGVSMRNKGYEQVYKDIWVKLGFPLSALEKDEKNDL